MYAVKQCIVYSSGAGFVNDRQRAFTAVVRWPVSGGAERPIIPRLLLLLPLAVRQAVCWPL